MKYKNIRASSGRSAVATLVLAALLPHEYAWAQLEEVVVTARKRTETLQEVPVSVTAISGDILAQFGVLAVRDLAEMTPNLTVGRGSVSQQVTIRGLGSFISNGGFTSAVGLGIDGLFFSQLPWLEVGMFDLQQAEVLRGPQGTYFGKNTTAGLISMVSRPPTQEPEGYITAGYETELEAYRVEGAVGGGLSDELRARLSGQYVDSDGWMKNAATGKPVEKTDREIIKLGLEWDASDKLLVTARTNYTDWHVDGNGTQVGHCGPGSPPGVLTLLPFLDAMAEDCVVDNKISGGMQRGPFDSDVQEFVDEGGVALGGFGTPYGQRAGVINQRNAHREIDAFSQSLGLTWDMGENSRILSITGYSDLKLDYVVDADFFDSPITELSESPPTIQIGFGPMFGFWNTEKYKNYSQELRFESTAGDSLEYVIGAYYEHEDTDLRDITDFSVDPFAFYASRDKGSSFDRDSWAVFGEITWEMSDDWRLILGGRYTEEDIDADTYAEVGSLGDPYDDDALAQALLSTVGITELDLSDDRNADNFSPEAVIQWDVSDEGILYASYKQGFKSGGFDGSVSGPASIPFYEYDDETVDSFEVGLKWETREWRANIAIFYSEYDDLQVQVFDGTLATVTRNAASATTEGFELDVLWAPLESVTVSLGLGYSDASYDSFKDAPCYTLQTEAQGCFAGFQDLSDEDLQLAPEWSGNLGLDWHHDLGAGLELHIGAAVNYRDEVWLSTTLDPDSREDDLTLLNLNVSLSGSDGQWTIAFIGRNLTDEEFRTAFADVPFHDAHQERLGLPNTYEFQFTYRLF